jgi:hypothetical protein
MSNEWTTDTLKVHYDRRFADSDKAIQAALAAQEKAIIKAEAAAERRFELLNELRQGVATKEQLELVEKLVQGLTDRMNRSEGQDNGSLATKGSMYAAIAAVGVILGILMLLARLVP